MRYMNCLSTRCHTHCALDLHNNNSSALNLCLTLYFLNNILFLENFMQYVLNMFTSYLPSHSFPPHFGIIIISLPSLPHGIQCVLLIWSWEWLLPWYMIYTSRDHIIKRTDSSSPSTCQMPLAHLVLGFCALRLSTSVLRFYQAESIKYLE